jgi:methylglutaconyl-CoA hydratase
MSDAALLTAVDPRGVATLTLNRPEKGNAYDQALLEMMAGVLAEHADDSKIRLLVLRGAGRHFCAGADLGDGSQAPIDPRITLPAFCRALDEFPKPTIALIHGACLGGGLAFAACCDVVIAARDAFFSLPEVRLGFAPLPLVPFLVRAINPRSLRRYLVSGERFDATEAQRIGLVHEVAEASALNEALAGAVAGFLEAGPGAAVAAKRVLRAQANGAITDDLLAELQREFRTGAESEEAREGRAAFRAKRKPRWVPKSD